MRRILSILILFMLIVGSVSCDSTRRASRRLGRIIQAHPELLSTDTIEIDTTIPVVIPADTALISMDVTVIDEDNSDSVVTVRGNHGTFTVARLASKRVTMITYQADSVDVAVHGEVVVPNITVDKRMGLDDIMTIIVIAVMAGLFYKMFKKE